MKEYWRSVLGLEGWYSVSTCARVRREQLGRKGAKSGKFLTGTRKGKGRLCFTLCAPDKKRTSVDVGVLMLEAFICKRPLGKECCHKDNNARHNTLKNLYWGTRSQNRLDIPSKVRSASSKKGHMSKSPAQRSEIRRKINAAMSPEKRSSISKKAIDTMRRTGVKWGIASLSKKERSRISKKWHAMVPRKNWIESAKKGWVTRRKNQALLKVPT